MLESISKVLVYLYFMSLFGLGFLYTLPSLQTKLKVSSDSISKVLSATIVYTVIIQIISYLIRYFGVSEHTVIYTQDGLLLFYLLSLFAWVSLGFKKRGSNTYDFNEK